MDKFVANMHEACIGPSMVQRHFVSWSCSSWNWVLASPSLLGRSGSNWTGTLSISTFSFITAYDRKLKRLVALDLKLGKFRSEYKGQMELYLRWLAKYEREEGEGLPLGLILCAEKNTEQIEMLELGEAGIHVAKYLTVLPAREALERKLHQAIAVARLRFKSKELGDEV